jgi:hypothetical protein
VVTVVVLVTVVVAAKGTTPSWIAAAPGPTGPPNWNAFSVLTNRSFAIECAMPSSNDASSRASSQILILLVSFTTVLHRPDLDPVKGLLRCLRPFADLSNISILKPGERL